MTNPNIGMRPDYMASISRPSSFDLSALLNASRNGSDGASGSSVSAQSPSSWQQALGALQQVAGANSLISNLTGSNPLRSGLSSLKDAMGNAISGGGFVDTSNLAGVIPGYISGESGLLASGAPGFNLTMNPTSVASPYYTSLLDKPAFNSLSNAYPSVELGGGAAGDAAASLAQGSLGGAETGFLDSLGTTFGIANAAMPVVGTIGGLILQDIIGGGWGKAENPWDDPSVPYNRLTPTEAAESGVAYNYNTPMTPDAQTRATAQWLANDPYQGTGGLASSFTQAYVNPNETSVQVEPAFTTTSWDDYLKANTPYY